MTPLEHLYSLTESLIGDRTRELGSVIDSPLTASETNAGVKSERIIQNTLKNQLAELAAALCNNMEDKLRVTSRYVSRLIVYENEAEVLEDI
jgi:nuclear pore complex protein Nup133